jgi:lactoylglutathione lyase
VKLAKPCIDVGVMTTRLEPMLAFWRREVGLPLEEVLPTGPGRRQHRHAMNGSVFKLNHSRDPLSPAPPSGYREVCIARAGLREPRALQDPDGNRVRLVPPGEEGITGIGVRLAVREALAFHRFYGEALELERCGERAYRCGDSLLTFDEDATAPRSDARLNGPGYRYITVQIHDVDAEHARVLSRGGLEGAPPRTLGQVARISFVRDPDGNWLELSQRASLTGPLPRA